MKLDTLLYLPILFMCFGFEPTASSIEIISAQPGKSLTLTYTSPGNRSIDYCQWSLINFNDVNSVLVKEATAEELAYGACSLTILRISPNHYGVWQCIATFEIVDGLPSYDTYLVNVTAPQDILIVIPESKLTKIGNRTRLKLNSSFDLSRQNDFTVDIIAIPTPTVKYVHLTADSGNLKVRSDISGLNIASIISRGLQSQLLVERTPALTNYIPVGENKYQRLMCIGLHTNSSRTSNIEICFFVKDSGAILNSNERNFLDVEGVESTTGELKNLQITTTLMEILEINYTTPGEITLTTEGVLIDKFSEMFSYNPTKAAGVTGNYLMSEFSEIETSLNPNQNHETEIFRGFTEEDTTEATEVTKVSSSFNTENASVSQTVLIVTLENATLQTRSWSHQSTPTPFSNSENTFAVNLDPVISESSSRGQDFMQATTVTTIPWSTVMFTKPSIFSWLTVSDDDFNFDDGIFKNGDKKTNSVKIDLATTETTYPILVPQKPKILNSSRSIHLGSCDELSGTTLTIVFSADPSHNPNIQWNILNRNGTYVEADRAIYESEVSSLDDGVWKVLLKLPPCNRISPDSLANTTYFQVVFANEFGRDELRALLDINPVLERRDKAKSATMMDSTKKAFNIIVPTCIAIFLVVVVIFVYGRVERGWCRYGSSRKWMLDNNIIIERL